jgi:hypothetical protein
MRSILAPAYSGAGPSVAGSGPLATSTSEAASERIHPAWSQRVRAGARPRSSSRRAPCRCRRHRPRRRPGTGLPFRVGQKRLSRRLRTCTDSSTGRLPLTPPTTSGVPSPSNSTDHGASLHRWPGAGARGLNRGHLQPSTGKPVITRLASGPASPSSRSASPSGSCRISSIGVDVAICRPSRPISSVDRGTTRSPRHPGRSGDGARYAHRGRKRREDAPMSPGQPRQLRPSSPSEATLPRGCGMTLPVRAMAALRGQRRPRQREHAMS